MLNHIISCSVQPTFVVSPIFTSGDPLYSPTLGIPATSWYILAIRGRKLRLDEPLDFSEGDHGVSGGIQVRPSRTWRSGNCYWYTVTLSPDIPWYSLFRAEIQNWECGISWDWFQIVETCWNIVSGTLRDDASSKDQLIIPFESMWCCLLRKNHKQGSILSVSRPAKKQ